MQYCGTPIHSNAVFAVHDCSLPAVTVSPRDPFPCDLSNYSVIRVLIPQPACSSLGGVSRRQRRWACVSGGFAFSLAIEHNNYPCLYYDSPKQGQTSGTVMSSFSLPQYCHPVSIVSLAETMQRNAVGEPRKPEELPKPRPSYWTKRGPFGAMTWAKVIRA